MKKVKMFEGVNVTNTETRKTEYYKDLEVLSIFNFENMSEKEIDDFKTELVRSLIVAATLFPVQIEKFEFQIVTKSEKEKLNLPW